MCWTVLPILMAYHDNGYFTMKEKICSAIRYNVVYYLIIFGIAIIIMILLLIKGMQGIT